jgi:predicted Zn-dependent protease
MTWLQRAHRHNEFDHNILSLLGTAVWQAREGDDIALSLCGKSVDLSPGDPLLRVRLARVQLHSGRYEQALANLSKCRGRSVDPDEVQLLKAAVYLKLQQTGKARYWAKRVQERCATESEPYRKAQVLLDSIS